MVSWLSQIATPPSRRRGKMMNPSEDQTRAIQPSDYEDAIMIRWRWPWQTGSYNVRAVSRGAMRFETSRRDLVAFLRDLADEVERWGK